MKKVVLMLAVGAFAFSMASCKKCSTCVVKDSAGDTFYTYPETCGNKSDIEDYENTCSDVYESVGYTCDCSE